MRTVQPILEATTGAQKCSIQLDSRDDAVENSVDEDISDVGSERLPVEKSTESLGGPANFKLELLESQGRGVQE